MRLTGWGNARHQTVTSPSRSDQKNEARRIAEPAYEDALVAGIGDARYVRVRFTSNAGAPAAIPSHLGDP